MKATESVCPICLAHVRARYTSEENGMYLLKECPEHGSFKTLAWRDAADYEDWAKGSTHARPLDEGFEPVAPCIEGCGLCGRHEGDTCIAVIHLTSRCNLSCPVCFADSDESSDHEPSFDDLSHMFRAIAAKPTTPTVQLSGGEPTIREDLPRIIRLAKARGINHLLLNTNGLRLASEAHYARKLAQAGLDTVYLQFDGLRDSTYLSLRKEELLETKIAAIKACQQAKLGIILVPTIYPNVNEDELGDIIAFAKECMPTVKGVHFQPVSYFGRIPEDAPLGPERITIPDVLSNLERQTHGEVPVSAMLPRRKHDAHCSFSSVFLLSNKGTLIPITNRYEQSGGLPEEFDFDIFAKEAIDFADKYWRTDLAKLAQNCCCGSDVSVAQAILDRTLVISGMHFQDAFNFDFDRLRGCCVHVVKPDGRFVPLCAEYLTAANGHRTSSCKSWETHGNSTERD